MNFANDHVNGDAGMQQLASCPDGTGAVIPGINFFGLREDCKLDRYVNFVNMDPAAFIGIRHNGVPFMFLNHNFGTLELNYNLTKDLALTSVTGYSKAKADSLINGTQTGYVGTTLSADNSFRRRDFTQELRLNSDFDSPLNFTAGGFYQDANMFNHVTVLSNTVLNTVLSLPCQQRCRTARMTWISSRSHCSVSSATKRCLIWKSQAVFAGRMKSAPMIPSI